jgi:coenzyme PQQ precursor peptide PqqA
VISALPKGASPLSCKAFLIRNSEFVHVEVMRYSCPSLIFRIVSSPKETTMKEWLKPEITESEAGMEVTSYLPAELDRA